MAGVVRHSAKRRHQTNWPGFILFALGAALALAIYPFISQSLQSLPRNARFFDARLKIEAVEADTVRYQSDLYRLVGFNTPATGAGAKCRSERVLADKAERRLRQLIADGVPRLQKVRCSCAPGTEGTQHCNNGRLCAVLLVSDVDVAETLIAEGLAERSICRGNSCPPRRNWCG